MLLDVSNLIIRVINIGMMLFEINVIELL